MKRFITIGIASLAMLGLAGCESNADTANRNVSVAAENFEVQRRLVAINGITDEYLFEVEGRCSWERGDRFFQATCKHGPNEYRRHDFQLGDNVTILSEQLDPIDVSEYRTRVVLKPEQIIPDIDVRTSVGEDE